MPPRTGCLPDQVHAVEHDTLGVSLAGVREWKLARAPLLCVHDLRLLRLAGRQIGRRPVVELLELGRGEQEGRCEQDHRGYAGVDHQAQRDADGEKRSSSHRPGTAPLPLWPAHERVSPDSLDREKIKLATSPLWLGSPKTRSSFLSQVPAVGHPPAFVRRC